jgi:hypothetical protein
VMFVKITGKKPSLEANNCYEEKVLHDLIKNSKSLRNIFGQKNSMYLPPVCLSSLYFLNQMVTDRFDQQFQKNQNS